MNVAKRVKTEGFIAMLMILLGLLYSPLVFSAGHMQTGANQASLQLTLLEDSGDTVPAMIRQHLGSHQDVIMHVPETGDDSLLSAEPLVEAAPVPEASIFARLSGQQRHSLREQFLQAEQAIEGGDDAAYQALAAQLKDYDYPLYPYLQYQWLSRHLQHADQVQQFLEQYGSTRYAGLLRARWLRYLARNHQWRAFLQHYTGSRDAAMQCRYQLARYHSGNREQALDGAAKLWAVGHSQPDACDPLFALLKSSENFTADLLWQRFSAAMRAANVRLAKYVRKYMKHAEQSLADYWLKLHRRPQHHLPELLRQANAPMAPAMFAHAIDRLAGRDVALAIQLWDDYKASFELDEATRNRLETRLAMKLALENSPQAYDRLGSLAKADDRSRRWRVRVALAARDWPRVIEAIQALDEGDQQREKWQYWLARASEETGDSETAERLYAELAVKRDFHGYLAADRLGQAYRLVDRPLQVGLQDIESLRRQNSFQAAHELMALGRGELARQQWWHALRQVDRQLIPAAARLAQQWGWHDVAIFTIARVQYWDDVELRFPLGYHDEIHKYALMHDLDPAIVFGIARRESAFNKDARSPVGARGLMQLMPATARHVVASLGERWRGMKAVVQPENNLKYGSWYYRHLLQQFDGNHAAALAAYNAGPHRVKRWLPEESLPADIWIETIPFRETRSYVSSVLVYAMIYQQRLQSDALSISDLATEVRPLSELARR